MSEYLKIKIELQDYPKRLNRTIAVNDDIGLIELGVLIANIFNAHFEHMFYFEAKKIRYVHSSWLNGNDKEEDMEDFDISDLGKNFTFVYDSGEDYRFKCSVDKKLIEIEDDFYDDDVFAFVLEGTGAGIFEDDKRSLEAYLDGEIDANFTSDEDNYFSLPMNMEFEKMGDFETSIIDPEPIFYFELEDMINGLSDEETKKEEVFNFLATNVAADIFLNNKVNEIFRELIKHYDINDAFEKILISSAEFFHELEEDDDDLDFEEMENKRIKHLRKLLVKQRS